MKIETITTEFHQFIPEVKDMEEGVLYISMEYATAIHKCFCGCGNQVVTPLAPSGWQLSFDGRVVSLSPSIGSFQLPCKSHYFIRDNKVEWA